MEYFEATYEPRRLRKHRRPVSFVQGVGASLVLSVGVVLICLFTQPSSANSMVEETSVSSQATLVSEFQQSIARTGGGITQHTDVDTSSIYVAASGLIPSATGTVVPTASAGTLITKGGPTHAYNNEGAFVINMEQLVAWECESVIAAEEVAGITTHKEAEEYAREKLSSKYIFSLEYSKASDNLSGAVGASLLRPDWIEAAGWTNKTNTQAGYVYAGFAGERQLDIMFVKESDIDSYYAGTCSDVYYVNWHCRDLKGHTAPWGVQQTFISYHDASGNQLYGLCKGTTGGYDGDFVFSATAPNTGDTVSDFVTLMENQRTSGVSAYKVPTLEASKQTYNAAYGGLQEVFEYWDNEHWWAFSDWYDSMVADNDPLVCVGVLVYTDREV